MSNNKIKKFLDKALNEMFKSVGFESFDSEFVKQKEWFSQKSWSEETEKKFKAWFYETAKKDLKWNKTVIEKEYSWFNLMYGWRIEQ